MKDEEFVMKEDIRERKQMAIGAKHMNRRGKGPINMGVEYKSDKEINEMHGEVKTYDLSKPISYNEFKEMPADLRGEYFKALFEKHGATSTRIMAWWKISSKTVTFLRRQYKVPSTAGKGRDKNRETESTKAWMEFMGGEEKTESETYIKTPSGEVYTQDPDKQGWTMEVEPDSVEPFYAETEPLPHAFVGNAQAKVSDAFFRVTGTPEDIYALLKSVTSGERRTYEISLMEEVRE